MDLHAQFAVFYFRDYLPQRKYVVYYLKTSLLQRPANNYFFPTKLRNRFRDARTGVTLEISCLVSSELLSTLSRSKNNSQEWKFYIRH